MVSMAAAEDVLMGRRWLLLLKAPPLEDDPVPSCMSMSGDGELDPLLPWTWGPAEQGGPAGVLGSCARAANPARSPLTAPGESSPGMAPLLMWMRR